VQRGWDAKRRERAVRAQEKDYTGDADELLALDPDGQRLIKWTSSDLAPGSVELAELLREARAALPGDGVERWPYCIRCGCWSSAGHVEGRTHLIKVERRTQAERQDSEGNWRVFCRVCRVFSTIRHFQTDAHKRAVPNWVDDEANAPPPSEGTSLSMRNFLSRKLQTIQDEEESADGSCAVISLSERVLTAKQVADWSTWDLVLYLKEYAPPRFLDRYQLTGRIERVQGRRSKEQLLLCVGLLHNALWEALRIVGALEDVKAIEGEVSGVLEDMQRGDDEGTHHFTAVM